MNNNKEQGITLIALVVTIVVLLILAAVTIAMLAGEDGIVKNAQKAKYENEDKSYMEMVQLAVNAAMIGENGYGELSRDRIISELNKLTDKTFSVSTEAPYTISFGTNTYRVSEDGTVTKVAQGGGNTLQPGETATATKNNYNGVTIPTGFTVSGNTNEDEVSEGLVIYRIDDNATIDWNNSTALETAKQNYDQFVWVPVEEAYIEESALASYTGETNYDRLKNYCTNTSKYPMAIKVGDNYKGILYTFSGTISVTITPNDYTTTSSIREPAYLSSYDNNSSYYNTNLQLSESSLQGEFNTMVTSVNSNGGFWVGRYETSKMNGNSSNDSTQQIEVRKGETEGVSNPESKSDGTGITWYRMYAQQKNYANKVGISKTSSMIWGSQWDQIMIWMKDVPNETTYAESTPFYVINSQGMGNYATSVGGTGEIANTGYYDVKNIYDLARKRF